jgi:hypothetical protein
MLCINFDKNGFGSFFSQTKLVTLAVIDILRTLLIVIIMYKKEADYEHYIEENKQMIFLQPIFV